MTALEDATAECPSCHTTTGHPHTPYCRASEQQRGHHLIASEAWVVPDNHPDDDDHTRHRVTIGQRVTTHHRSLCRADTCGWEPVT